MIGSSPVVSSQRQFGAAITATLIHSVAWLIAFLGMRVALSGLEQMSDDVNLRLPWFTELVLSSSHPVLDHPLLFGLGLLTFLVVDCWILMCLGRPDTAGVLRELWSGLALILPLLLIAIAGLATRLPHQKLAEATSKWLRQREQAYRADQERLQGEWRFVSGKHQGRAVPQEKLPDTLVFDGDQFAWTTSGVAARGSYVLTIQLPLRFLELSYGDGQYQGRTQVGAYAVQGDKLVLYLAPPAVAKDRAMVDFAGDNENMTVYTLARAGRGHGK
jgi:uncharacterized protein (TIGR03067 family)